MTTKYSDLVRKAHLSAVAGIALASAIGMGCATQDPTRVYMNGIDASYVKPRAEIEAKIGEYQLRSWDAGKELYAEGRTYGQHFAEFATSTNLLDGSARDGCKAPGAVKRK